ncbi:SLC13 family permease [Roseococcus pinisoli]|uniref:SLC13 family permease n=1 Tax=Roseococcus pinisoli TaxID=2835040 RepID=A0ABS5QD03_9PROT|nr:SLC13 family permease [Roseococcus pinisoli]MBS7811363.1 SLC13 family permease [Roseococcus pinisoli]
MSDITITFTIIGVMVLLFVSNRAPIGPVALAAALTLYFTGILDHHEALAGFGDTTVLFIASLFVVSASLDATGVTAWAGKLLIAQAGKSRRRLLILAMLLVGFLTALIGSSGAVSALLPVLVLVAVRLGWSPSQLMMPLAFASYSGSMLVLTGSLVNVLVSDAATEAGMPPFGYFEVTAVGLPLLAGTIVIVVFLGEKLLPMRAGRGIPQDLSRHSGTLAEQYQVFESIHRLVITPDSPFVGQPSPAIEAENRPGLSLIAVRPGGGRPPIANPVLAAGDVLFMRGEAQTIADFAADKRLENAEPARHAEISASLFNQTHGFTEVVLPPRSNLIGDTVFPGMVTPAGDLIILGIQRRGENQGPGKVVLAVGDTLLIQGRWEALEKHSGDHDVLVVAAPEAIRGQAIPLGTGAARAVTILVMMVVALATGVVPSVVAGVTAACAAVLLGVLKVERAYRAINWTALIMIASLIPLSTAMRKTGAAELIADTLVGLLGEASPYKMLAALFVLTALLGQLISSTATALILIPVAIAAATEIGISPRTALVTVAIAAAASFLTPIASSASLMVQGPGGYRFGDYWKLGLPLLGWSFLIATFLVPVFWPF